MIEKILHRGDQGRRGVWVSVGNKGKLFAGRAPVVKPHSVQRAVPGKTRGREGGFIRGNNPRIYRKTTKNMGRV